MRSICFPETPQVFIGRMSNPQLSIPCAGYTFFAARPEIRNSGHNFSVQFSPVGGGNSRLVSLKASTKKAAAGAGWRLVSHSSFQHHHRPSLTFVLLGNQVNHTGLLCHWTVLLGRQVLIPFPIFSPSTRFGDMPLFFYLAWLVAGPVGLAC